jgi:hypothetical protein
MVIENDNETAAADDRTRQLFEEAFERSIHNWLDKKFMQFGRWSFTGILLAIFGAWMMAQLPGLVVYLERH